MATNEAPLPPGVTVSERLWSEELAIAAADSPLSDADPNRQPGYEFSNGRSFNTRNPPYGSTS